MASCINWAWKIQGLKLNQKFLLIAMADDADPRTGTCFMTSSTARFAEDLGVSRRYIQRLTKELISLDLVHTTEKNPGTDDGQMFFHLHIDVDPLNWEPKYRQKSPSAIMSTSAFQQLLHAEFSSDPVALRRYQTWLAPIRIVKIERKRLIIRSHAREAVSVVNEALPLILKIAREHINSEIKRIRPLYPPEQRKRIQD